MEIQKFFSSLIHDVNNNKVTAITFVYDAQQSSVGKWNWPPNNIQAKIIISKNLQFSLKYPLDDLIGYDT